MGALVTATLQQAAGGFVSLALSVPVSASSAAMDPGLPAPAGGPVPWVVLVWAATSAVAAFRLAHGWIHVRRAAGRRRVMSSGPLRRQLDGVLESAGATRRITLSCSRGLAVPRAIGTREICVPVRVLRDLSPAEQRALLAHEAAHVLRRDTAWLFVAALLQTLAWWQPLTRLAVARLRRSMELCCDDWASSRIPDRMALAECLVKVGEWSVPALGGFTPVALAMRGSAFRERVERLIDAERPEDGAPRWRWLAAAPLLVVLGLAPRVILAQASALPSFAVVRTTTSETAGAAPDRRSASAPGAHPITAIRRPAVPGPRVARIDEPVHARVDEPVLPRADEAVPARASEPAQPLPGTEVPVIITMPDLARPPAPTLRAALAAVRIAPPAAAPPQPLIVKSDVSRRIGLWVDYQRRTFSFDPYRPSYVLR